MTTWTFVTSAGADIGHGHAARVATLATAAARHGSQVRVCIPHDVPLPPALNSVEFETSPVSFTEDDLGALVATASSSAVVVLDLPDSVMAGLDWMSNLPHLRVAFRLFGPPHEGAFEHVSLTPAFEAPTVRLLGSTGFPQVVATGWDLIIVRPSLFGKPGDKNQKLPTVLITMGGADPLGLTEQACDDLVHGDFAGKVVVIVGASNPRLDEIAKRYGTRFEIYKQGEIDFDHELRGASVAVINGGLTRYECLAAETPFVAISIHEAQHSITEQVTKLGFGVNLGVHTDISEGSLNQAVTSLLSKQGMDVSQESRVSTRISPDAPVRLLDRCLEWQRSLLP